MKHFLNDRRGSAYIWTAFIILILMMLTVVVYNGAVVYAKYQAAETELQRAALITVDTSVSNANLRDVVLDIPAVDAEQIFLDNLAEAGFEKDESDWSKYAGAKLIYTLENMRIEVEGKSLTVTAELAIPVIWETDSAAMIRIPIQIKSSVFYIQ